MPSDTSKQLQPGEALELVSEPRTALMAAIGARHTSEEIMFVWREAVSSSTPPRDT